VINFSDPNNANRQLAGFIVGQITTNDSGAITVYYGEGVGSGRTQFDGVLFDVVPEPSSFALLGLGGLCLLRRRRK